MLHPYNGILFSCKIEETIDTCYNMGELENMFRERSQTQENTSYLILFKYTFQRKQIYRDRKQISGCLGLRVEGGLTVNGYEGDRKVLKQVVVIIVQFYIFAEKH